MVSDYKRMIVDSAYHKIADYIAPLEVLLSFAFIKVRILCNIKLLDSAMQGWKSNTMAGYNWLLRDANLSDSAANGHS